MIKIGFLGTYFEEKQTGIGNYVLSLFDQIFENIPNIQLIVYSKKKIILPKKYLANPSKVILREDPHRIAKLNINIWVKFRLGEYLRRDNLDYFFSGTGFFPTLAKEIRKIAVLHDLNYKIVPKTMGRFQYLSHFLFLKRDIQQSDFVIVNSQGTANKMKHFFNKDADCVINPPLNVGIFHKPLEKDLSKFLEQKKLGNYFLTVGTLEPRKNLIFTINCFIDLIKKHEVDAKLLLVGGGGWKNENLKNYLEDYKDWIYPLGFVSNDELVMYYAGAKALLFPSIYEGYGMPVEEALATGTKVIATDIEELREAGRGSKNAFFFKKNNASDFKELIKRISKMDQIGYDFIKPDNNIELQKLINFLK